MKLKIQSLLLTVMLGMVIVSCNDDDDAVRSNAYEFDGKKKDIKTAIWEDNTRREGRGGYSFLFSAEEFSEDEELSEYIEIDVPHLRMGTKFDLTEENPYDWSWMIGYRNSQSEFYYRGFGDVGYMEDVERGTMSATDNGDGAFEIEAEIVFTDGKTLKLYYAGKMTEWDEEESRKMSTQPAKNTSLNQN